MTKAEVEVEAEAGLIPVSEAKKLARAAEKDGSNWAWTKAWAFAHQQMADTAWEAVRAAAKESAKAWVAFQEGALERAEKARAEGKNSEQVWAKAAEDAATLAAKAEAVFAAGNPFS